ncbi:MAG: AvaI/BsoBI family type II restriction endonuclease [Phycisphaerae bacterium]
MPKLSRPHLRSSTDLITPYAATRAGFVQMALEKNRKATPLISEARTLQIRAASAKIPAELLDIPDIQPAMLAAAGISDKAMTHLQREDKSAALLGLVKNFLEPAGSKFVEELVFRFLLTRGDTLGGSMRNIAGALAQRKLARAIISSFRLARQRYYWLESQTNSWVQGHADDADIEIHLKGLAWQRRKISRTLIYNLTLPLTKNNVDLCLFDCDHQAFSKEIYRIPQSYIALGEIKGGIDPAGADEHWKTARTALLRIQAAFAEIGLRPKSFFIGGAIEAKMAEEIWKFLANGQLDNAANLTSDQQLDHLARWLCSL